MSHHHNHKKKSPFKGILLIFAVVASAGFWGFTLYSDYDIYEGSYEIRAADHLNITNIEFHYEVEVASVNIDIKNSSTDNIMNSEWKHLFGSWGATDLEPVEIQFENYTVGDTLVIIVTSTGDLNSFNGFNGINIWEFDISLNPGYIYNFTTQSSVGSVDLTAINTEFNGISLNEQTGHVDLKFFDVNITSEISAIVDTGSVSLLMHNTAMNENLNIETGTGYIEINLNNSTTGAIYATTDTGSTDISLTDTKVLGDFNIETSTGYIEIDLNNSTTGAMYATTDTGSIDISLINTKVSGELDFQTGTGYIEVEIYDLIYTTAQMISLDSDTGSVDMYLYQSGLPYPITIDMTTNTGYIDADFYTPEGQDSQIVVSATTDTGSSDVEFHYF